MHWNRNLTALAIAQRVERARHRPPVCLVHTAVSDAIIVGFEAKYRYSTWRPRTAIPQADNDGNPHTDADPSWRPLLTVNHPEYPSGHGFWSTALLDAVASFFGTEQVDVDDHDVKDGGAPRRADRTHLRRPQRAQGPRSSMHGCGADCTGDTPCSTARRSAGTSPRTCRGASSSGAGRKRENIMITNTTIQPHNTRAAPSGAPAATTTTRSAAASPIRSSTACCG